VGNFPHFTAYNKKINGANKMKHPNERPSTLPSLDDLRKDRYEAMLEALKGVNQCLDNQFQHKDELIPAWIVEAYEIIEKTVNKVERGR